MKRRDLIRLLREAGFSLVRRGGNHDIFGRDALRIPVPRHREVNELTARAVLRQAGLDPIG